MAAGTSAATRISQALLLARESLGLAVYLQCKSSARQDVSVNVQAAEGESASRCVPRLWVRSEGSRAEEGLGTCSGVRRAQPSALCLGHPSALANPPLGCGCASLGVGIAGGARGTAGRAP